MDILKETEADTKNFFGSYGSQRMKDWQEVVSLYRRDNVYLAEAAQLLSQVMSGLGDQSGLGGDRSTMLFFSSSAGQACTYEIPGLKKQLAKSIQVQEECEKKEKDNSKRAKEFRADFQKSCHQLGIK